MQNTKVSISTLNIFIQFYMIDACIALLRFLKLHYLGHLGLYPLSTMTSEIY